MPVLLEVLQVGNREKPTVLKFGANEVIMMYRTGEVHICNAYTYAVHEVISNEILRDWGYSPASLIQGNRTDQFLYVRKNGISMDDIKGGLSMLFVILIVCVISHFSGCTEYMLKQLDKDIATTTYYPVQNLKNLGE